MTQQKNLARDRSAPDTALPVDPIRLEQFLALQSDLLSASDPGTLPERCVHAVATFIDVPGAAVGIVQDGLYRIVASIGLDVAYTARYDRSSLRNGPLASVLTEQRAAVLDDVDGRLGAITTVALPFRGAELTGALHLVRPVAHPLADDAVHLARVLAAMAGIGLANAAQCRRLAENGRLKGEALAAMAHDLRSPLNALIGYANLLGDGAFGPLTPEQAEVTAALERQALELVDLLGAALDVARLETGRLPVRREEFALADVLGVLADGTFARPTRDEVVRWRIPGDLPALRTDRVKVKQIVQNLVENALRHGRGGAVAVEAVPAPDGEAVRITVRDTGPGIAPDVLPYIFEPFRAGQGRASGFGLYIVRCFAEALGGRVAARTAPGEGAAITVELPLGPPQR